MEDWSDFVSPGMLTRQVALAEHVVEQLAPLIKRVPATSW
jgi:hypothetical protein